MCDCDRRKKCHKKVCCKKLKCLCVPTFDEKLVVYGRTIAQKILNSIPLSVGDFPPGGLEIPTRE